MEVKGTSTSVDSQNVNMVVTETRAMDTGNGPGIAFKGPINTNATPGESTFAVIRAGKLNNTADNTSATLQFFTANNGSNPTEAMRIDNLNRVLIGQVSNSQSPTANLECTVRISGRSDGANQFPRLRLDRVSTSGIADNGGLGELSFGSTQEATNHRGAAISASRDGGTWTADTSIPTRLEFSTTPDGKNEPVERMRISSTGIISFPDDTALAWGTGTNRPSISGSETTDEIVFNVNGGLRMRLDQRGNLGLNSVIPAINTNYRSVNVNTTGFLNANSNSYFGCENNAYVGTDGNWKYRNTGRAVSIGSDMSDGKVYFRRAASGTASTDITWSNTFTIAANGDGIFDSTGTQRRNGDLEVSRSAGNTTISVIEGSETGNGAALELCRSRNTLASPDALTTNNWIGQLKFVGHNDSGLGCRRLYCG